MLLNNKRKRGPCYTVLYSSVTLFHYNDHVLINKTIEPERCWRFIKTSCTTNFSLTNCSLVMM